MSQSTPVHNPATGEKLYDVVHATSAEIDSAVQKAQAAFEKW